MTNNVKNESALGALGSAFRPSMLHFRFAVYFIVKIFTDVILTFLSYLNPLSCATVLRPPFEIAVLNG